VDAHLIQVDVTQETGHLKRARGWRRTGIAPVTPRGCSLYEHPTARDGPLKREEPGPARARRPGTGPDRTGPDGDAVPRVAADGGAIA
jgi:hypothetical protein